MKGWGRLASALLVGVLGSGALAAQQASSGAAPATAADSAQAPAPAPLGANAQVYLVTFGRGDLVWEVWGHNAIWFKDAAEGLDAAFNWGMFNFAEPGFLGRLAMGTMHYAMYGLPGSASIAEYPADNRDVYLQELRLTPEQKVELLANLIELNVDENRYYTYDYYRDNCSTRVRDAIDGVIGGRIRATLEPQLTEHTWRWHGRRLIHDMKLSLGGPLNYAGMEFILGHKADERINRWQETFLPMLLMDDLRDVTVLDAAGSEVPLVLSETRLFESTRPPDPIDAPSWTIPFLLIGILGGGLIAGLGSISRRGSRAAAWLSGSLATAWSFVAGIGGLLALFVWAVTDHVFLHSNENLLQLSPLSMVLVIGFVAAHFSAGVRWLVPLAFAALALSVLGLVMQGIPGFDQVNGEIIALALPLHAGVAWAALQLTGSREPRVG
jgi:hypothetical protein